MKNDPSHALLREADGLGHEARAGRGDHAVLRLWLRLLASTTQIENEVRRRCGADYLAASGGLRKCSKKR